MKLNFVKLKFVPRDLWIGVFIDAPMYGTYVNTYAVYICIVPMFPIKICWSVIK